MPSPSTSLATLRPDLAGSLEQFDLAMDREGFIGSQVLPVFDAARSAGTFGKIPLAQLLQTRDTTRAPGATYSRGSYKFEPDTYTTQEQGAEEPVDDNDRENYRDYLDAELVATARAYDAVLRNQEIRVAAMIFNATTWTGASLTTAITNEWDDAANAVPITDVEAAVRKVWENSGLWPNTLIINRHVFRNLRNCDSIIERVNAAGAGSPSKPSDITLAMLSAVFDLPRILVGGSAKNTALEGAAAAIGKIWSDEYAMVCRTAVTNDIREPCIGRTFHWAQDGSQIGGTVEEYREEQTRSDIKRVRHQVGEKTLYVQMGHLLSNVTT